MWVAVRAWYGRVAMDAFVLAMAEIVDANDFPAATAAFVAIGSEPVRFVIVVLGVPLAQSSHLASMLRT